MAVTPVPDLSVPQNVGYDETSTSPVIHSARWRHLPSRYTFSDVQDVITYHDQGSLVIDIQSHSVSYLDIYLLKDVGITEFKVYLRFVRETDGVLIEERYTIGEGGRRLEIVNDPSNDNLKVVRGIAFTQNDLLDGTPMYDFMSMTKEGIYEVWFQALTSTGEELHVRIPFQWANLTNDGSSGGGDSGEDGGTSPETGKLSENYDEYYVTLVEGSSPFTKRPSTHFRFAGIGMLANPFCFERIDDLQNPSDIANPDTEEPPVIDRPSEEPIVGDDPLDEPCDLTLVDNLIMKEVGQIADFELVHSNNSGIVDIVGNYNPSYLEEVGETSFRVLNEGTFTVNFDVIYENGQECSVSATVTGEEPSEPSLSCGETAYGDRGHGEYIHDVSESGLYYVDYDFKSAPDTMYVYVGDSLIYSTGEMSNKDGSPFGFNYDPSQGQLKVVMNDGGSGTIWEYTLYCPSNVPDNVKNDATIVN